MLVEDEPAAAPPTAAEENERFATAVTTRALHTLPHLLRDAPAKVDTVLLQLESMATTAAAKGESRLLLGTLKAAPRSLLMIDGLDEGLRGMRAGGTRRSALQMHHALP